MIFHEDSQHLRAVLSNASGSISLACWIILLLPQLIEQWRLKSADGVAIGFILAWFFGDIANLMGSVIGHLRPSVIMLAMWFCFSDTLLLVSYLYYKRLATSSTTRLSSRIDNDPALMDSERRGGNTSATSQTPLLQESTTSTHSLPNTNADVEDRRNWMLGTFLPAVFVVVVSTLSFFISDTDGSSEEPVKSGGAQVLGYISAALYLLARIPQIVQNHRRRSVEGLSMGFFTLSILGNVTYASQVIFLRTDKAWLMTYLPWLLGSLGTIAEDFVVLAQFYIYKRK